MDYFKFFNKKSSAQTPQVKDTKEVIENLQENQDKIKTNDKIEILGRKNPRYTDKAIIEENLNGFKINRWIPKSNEFSKQLTTENYRSEISKELERIFSTLNLSTTAEIDDLFKRFQLLKTVQQSFILSIPDSKFTLLNSFDALQTYLFTNLNPSLKLSKKSEFQPDAVDLNPSDFQGTNVSISEFVFKSDKERAYKSLLKKASKLEKSALKEYNEKTATQ